jgi:hypothetical protein
MREENNNADQAERVLYRAVCDDCNFKSAWSENLTDAEIAKAGHLASHPGHTVVIEERVRRNAHGDNASAPLQSTYRVLNCIPSEKSNKDFLFDDALETGFVRAGAIPDEKDLREAWWAINDQGSTGSCVGWATADSLMRWHFVKKSVVDPNTLLSIRFIWMSAKETDEFNDRPTTFIESSGTSLKSALDIARRYGCVLDAVLPFADCRMFADDENVLFSLATKLRIRNYFNLTRETSKTAAWKNWIGSGNGPILTRLNVDQTWDDATTNGGNLDTYLPETGRGGHAVAIVGYTKDRFIIRNSWGNGWGDGGYAYASYDYAEQAFTEAFGIQI